MTPVGTHAAVQPVRARALLCAILTGIRPHQWIKNLFVLAPLLFSGRLRDGDALREALTAFASFCLISSAVYLINDIADSEADRNHPEKRLRPIASGALDMRTAAGTCALLLAGAVAAAWPLRSTFGYIEALYFASTLAYCLFLKQATILDCIIVASGFVLRVAGGAAAIGVEASHWLIVCTFVLALYLAFSKRRQELLALPAGAKEHRQVLGRYTVPYVDQVNTILLATAIVCYALYTVAADTVARFGTERLIYGTAFVIYGLLRYLLLTQNADSGGDPGRLLLRDKPLGATIICWAAYNAAVIYWR